MEQNELAASDILCPKLIELLGLPKNMRKLQITLERFEPIKVSGEVLEEMTPKMPGAFTISNYACEIHLLDPNVQANGRPEASEACCRASLLSALLGLLYGSSGFPSRL